MSDPMCPPELRLTTRDGGSARSIGTNRLVRRKCPMWLVPNCISKPSTVRSGGVYITPALLISRCSRSCVSEYHRAHAVERREVERTRFQLRVGDLVAHRADGGLDARRVAAREHHAGAGRRQR